MHIIHITSELAPIAKVGGLADVVFGMARESQKKGDLVEVFLPKYDSIDPSFLQQLKLEYRDLWSYDGTQQHHNSVWSIQIHELKVLLLEAHHPAHFFDRGAIYSCQDDIDRFIYFSRAVLEYLFKSGKKIDILHIHDWPTSLVALLYKKMYRALGFFVKGVVLTIHNLQYQGKCNPHHLTRAGIYGREFLTPEELQDPLIPTDINLLKGGMEYADAITTVSLTYEQEIKAPGGGHGLEASLLRHQHKLRGILNGIDFDYWNPQTDPFLFKRYSLKDAFQGKSFNKKQFLKKLQLLPSKGPLICSISRLDPQKGLNLITYTLKYTLENEGQFILIGSTHDPNIQTAFEELQKEFSKNKNIFIHLKYDEQLAHQTYAASDIIVVPSLSEPCGLTQMIALRYGAIPVVRSTGGLSDTIFDLDTSCKPIDKRNGFCFNSPNVPEMDSVLNRAISCYRECPERWTQMIRSGMSTDLSWSRSSDAYHEIYCRL